MTNAKTWEERQIEKELARKQDEEDLRSGRKTREQLRAENAHPLVKHLDPHEPLDWDKIGADLTKVRSSHS